MRSFRTRLCVSTAVALLLAVLPVTVNLTAQPLGSTSAQAGRLFSTPRPAWAEDDDDDHQDQDEMHGLKSIQQGHDGPPLHLSERRGQYTTACCLLPGRLPAWQSSLSGVLKRGSPLGARGGR